MSTDEKERLAELRRIAHKSSVFTLGSPPADAEPEIGRETYGDGVRHVLALLREISAGHRKRGDIKSSELVRSMADRLRRKLLG